MSNAWQALQLSFWLTLLTFALVAQAVLLCHIATRWARWLAKLDRPKVDPDHVDAFGNRRYPQNTDGRKVSP